jgi:hypothetical protein
VGRVPSRGATYDAVYSRLENSVRSTVFMAGPPLKVILKLHQERH